MRKPKVLTKYQELVMWAARLEAYVNAHAESYELYRRLAVQFNNRDFAQCEKLLERIKAEKPLDYSQLYHTPEFRKMVVQAYDNANYGNRKRVLRTFRVTAPQYYKWKSQLETGESVRRSGMVGRLKKKWIEPTEVEIQKVDEDFTAKLAAEQAILHARESFINLRTPRNTTLPARPLGASSRVNDEETSFLKEIDPFEFIE